MPLRNELGYAGADKILTSCKGQTKSKGGFPVLAFCLLVCSLSN